MGRKTVSCTGIEATLSSSEEARGRFGANGDSPLWASTGPATIPGPCMHACRQARIPAGGALEDCQRSIGKRPAPSFLVLYTVADVTLIARGRQRNTPPRLGARPRGDAGLRGDFARLIAAIGDLPPISLIVSDSRGRLPIAGKDLAESYPRSASPRRRPVITCRRRMSPRHGYVPASAAGPAALIAMAVRARLFACAICCGVA